MSNLKLGTRLSIGVAWVKERLEAAEAWIMGTIREALPAVLDFTRYSISVNGSTLASFDVNGVTITFDNSAGGSTKNYTTAETFAIFEAANVPGVTLTLNDAGYFRLQTDATGASAKLRVDNLVGFPSGYTTIGLGKGFTASGRDPSTLPERLTALETSMLGDTVLSIGPDEGDDFGSLQEAITYLESVPTESAESVTLLLPPGATVENVTVNRPLPNLTIQGHDGTSGFSPATFVSVSQVDTNTWDVTYSGTTLAAFAQVGRWAAVQFYPATSAAHMAVSGCHEIVAVDAEAGTATLRVRSYTSLASITAHTPSIKVYTAYIRGAITLNASLGQIDVPLIGPGNNTGTALTINLGATYLSGDGLSLPIGGGWLTGVLIKGGGVYKGPLLLSNSGTGISINNGGMHIQSGTVALTGCATRGLLLNGLIDTTSGQTFICVGCASGTLIEKMGYFVGQNHQYAFSLNGAGTQMVAQVEGHAYIHPSATYTTSPAVNTLGNNNSYIKR